MTSFYFAQAGWLGIALVTAGTLATIVRAPPTTRSITARAVRAVVVFLILLGLSAALLVWPARSSQYVLAGCALFAGARLINAAYRRTAPAPVLLGFVCRALRFAAWVLLLALLARPTLERQVVTWRKPLLAVLLDQSDSMAIVDPAEVTGRSRAQRVNAELRAVESDIKRLDTLYDVRRAGVGGQLAPRESWQIAPKHATTNLAGALQAAAAWRTERGQPPHAVLLVTDGGENHADRAAVLAGAAALAEQGTALVAIGAGPVPGEVPLVELTPLNVPPRIGPHEALPVNVSGWIEGVAGRRVRIDVLWNKTIAETTHEEVRTNRQAFAELVRLTPPGVGMHRLTARVALPPDLGGHSFTTSTLVEVVADRLRVRLVSQGLRTEGAFIARALAADPSIDLSRDVDFDPPPPLAQPSREPLWLGADVVLLGPLRQRLPAEAAQALAEAVAERGLGLALIGGADLAQRAARELPLANLSPTLPSPERGRHTSPQRIQPTAAGRRHPVLRAALKAAMPSESGEENLWQALPGLPIPVALGAPKPAAVPLLMDGESRPVLVVQEIGLGRCVLASWESTWPWALVSRPGHEFHGEFWRNLVRWLANRRPQAWVATERAEYPLAPLKTGQVVVHVRAGVTGLTADQAAAVEPWQPQLTLRNVARNGEFPASAPATDAVAEWPILLTPTADGWQTDLAAGTSGWIPAAGEYELELVVKGPVGEDIGIPQTLRARTRFPVSVDDLERRPPTADLGLVRAAAQRTAAAGGQYVELAELGSAVRALVAADRRERVETRETQDLIRSHPWWWLGLLTAALGLEWLLRKRHGLS